MKPLVLTLLALLLAPVSIPAQEATAVPRIPRRVATLTAGMGNVMGWFGAHAEGYFARERLSAFVGLGYTPSIDPGDPSGPTFAVGLRGFTTGFKHRGFLALSVSQLAVRSGLGGFVENPSRFYGPGLEAGYQYASRGGFTFMASLGLGYAPGVPEGEKEVGEVLALGFGYTWRR
jgi:hypothetical protein